MEKKKKAKSEVLRKLSDQMRGMMRDDYDDSDLDKKMMKVTVAAKDQEGLKKGLSKADEIMKSRMGDEMMESPEEMSESDESEKDELLKKIEQLEKKLETKEE